MIRDASDNKKGLDDVFRELYQTAYKQKWTGFTSEQWWAAVSRAAGGKSFDDFNAKYIDGREPMPFATVLPLAGFRLKVDTIREPRLGVTSAPDSSGVRVAEVQPGSPAEAAGLRPGDYLDPGGRHPGSRSVVRGAVPHSLCKGRGHEAAGEDPARRADARPADRRPACGANGTAAHARPGGICPRPSGYETES